MAFSSLQAIDPMLLHMILPFPVGLLTSWIFYGWVKKVGLQSESFSPTVASILTTPLLAVGYYMVAMAHQARVGPVLLFLLALFAPIIVPLSLLLKIYLRGGFRSGKLFGALLSATSVAVVILEVGGLYLILNNTNLE